MPCSKKHILYNTPFARLAFILPVLISLASLFTCTKDEPRLMKVLNDRVDAASVTTAIIFSTVVDIGEGVDKYGHCWSIWENPTLDHCEHSTSFFSLTGPGPFIDSIAGLSAASHYFIKAYLQKGKNIVYSNSLDFNTLTPTSPVVHTGDPVSVSTFSIVINGIIESIGLGSTGITNHGHCWSPSNPTPTLSDSLTFLGPRTTTGAYTSTLLNLISNTPYYVRSYATNEFETSYGETKMITTDLIIPTVSTASVTDITTTTCKCGGEVISQGAEPVTAYGVCYSTNENPTLANFKTIDGSGTGSYSSDLSGLRSGTKYYVKAYATNARGTAYGNQVSFTTNATITSPTVTTSSVTAITSTTARCGGDVTNDGGASVTKRGVCWNTDPNPTIANHITDDGSGTGPYTSDLSGLISSTPYFVRAYATNTQGTAYGNQVSFTAGQTITSPNVNTSSVTLVTSTTARCGGDVTSDGGATVTARGVCWSTGPDPTLSDYHTDEGSGTGVFTSDLSGLKQNTTYYVKAYATNSQGTAYGSVVSFKTDFECGNPFLDSRNNKSYNTVIIGKQCWMAENLNIGTMVDSVADQTDLGTIEKYCYRNLESNCSTFGGIYQWNEMMQYSTTESVRGICPDGWHIPSDNEWKVLEVQLGMSSADAELTGWRGTDEGGQLKAAGTEYWYTPNTGASNSSGFTALPAGWVSSRSFVDKGYAFVIWTSSTNGEYSWYRDLTYSHSDIYRYYGSRPNGTPVRCVMD